MLLLCLWYVFGVLGMFLVCVLVCFSMFLVCVWYVFSMQLKGRNEGVSPWGEPEGFHGGTRGDLPGGTRGSGRHNPAFRSRVRTL
jgi:hypothetical protein